MHYKKIIREWAGLRHHDPQGVYEASLSLYRSLLPDDQKKMLNEFQNYIIGVKSGRIKPSVVKIKRPGAN